MNRRYFITDIILSLSVALAFIALPLSRLKPLFAEEAKKTFKVDDKKCINCGTCLSVCEPKAITLGELHASIDNSKCTGCGKCKDVCPQEAIMEVI